MTGHYAAPQYADYKKFIAEVYPEAATRIAVTRKGTPVRWGAMEAELRSQLPADVISAISEDAFSEQLKMVLNANATRRSSGRFPVIASARAFDNNQEESEQVEFCYIMLPSRMPDPAALLHHLSNHMVPPMRMKFNQAAQNPVALQWFLFFHELCHCLVKLKIQPSSPGGEMKDIIRKYYQDREETLCDSYAAAQTLRVMGEGAIPTLRVLADMRLSRLSLSGQKYFTSLAIGEVLNRAEQDGIERLRAMGRDALHAYVLQITADNYFSRGDFSVLHPAFNIVNDPSLSVSMEYRRSLAMDTLDKVTVYKLKSQAGTYDRKIADECMRSFGIMERNYSYASLFEKVKDKIRQVCIPDCQSDRDKGPMFRP